MKSRCLIIAINLIAVAARAQVALSYYPFQSILSLSSNTEKLFWFDYRVETNSFLSSMNMEISPMCNFKRTEKVNYYTGPGINFNPFYLAADLPVVNGYFIDIGARIKPFVKNRSVQFLFEISPYVNSRLASGNLRTRLGVGYNFIRKKQVEEKKTE
jgi:hypothetical protein